jgi:iron(III) transport system substrate-binding protein
MCTLAVAGLMLGASVLSTTQAQTPAPTFQQVLEGARQEGELTLVFVQPGEEANRTKLADAFNKRFGLSLKITFGKVHPYTVLQRLNIEAAAGKFSFDVSESNAYSLTTAFEKGWIKAYPWVEVFGKELPAIAKVVPAVAPELRNTMLPYRDNVYGPIWNTDRVSEADAPRRYLDLVNPKWRGKLAIDSPDMEPLAHLINSVDRAQVLDMAKRVLENQPLLKPSSGAIIGSVSSGEALVGTANSTAALLAKKRGEPIGFRVFEDYVFVVPVTMYVPVAPPHPNAARLFTAWMATEGVHLVDNEPLGTLSDTSTSLGKLLAPMVKPGAKIIKGRNVAEYQAVEKVLKDINKMTTGMTPAQ